MKLGRLGVWYSTDRLDGTQLADLLRVIEQTGYAALWYPESRGYESMSRADYLRSKSTRIVIGSSIANIYARDSFTARRAMTSLNACTADVSSSASASAIYRWSRACAVIAMTSRFRRCAPISTASTRICRQARRRP